MGTIAYFSLLLAVGAVSAADVSRRQLPTRHCDTICNEEEETGYASVCGTDGVLYKSKCEYNNALCSSIQSGGDILRYVSIGPECVTTATSCDVMKRTQCIKTFPGIGGDTGAIVCGTDGLTYGSVCELMYRRCLDPSSSQLEVDHDGSCGPKLGNDSRTVNCSQYVVDLGGLAFEGGSHVTLSVRPCQKIFKPICGIDGRTYSNECMFCGSLALRHVIQTGHLTAPILHDGSCGITILG